MVNLLQLSQTLGWRTRSLTGTVSPVDLGLICATVHHGCMGLPQELVDNIMGILHNDFRALAACSLTCKSMFASARHLIHGTFRLTQRNNRSILTREEKKLLPQMSTDRELRFLTCAAERGLLQYAQQVFIRNNLQLDNHHSTFSPAALSPHLHHFRSLDRIHTLTIEHLDAALPQITSPLWKLQGHPAIRLAISEPRQPVFPDVSKPRGGGGGSDRRSDRSIPTFTRESQPDWL